MLELQRKNLAAERIKQQYGQTTALNVNIIVDNLLQQEIDFINSQIGYLTVSPSLKICWARLGRLAYRKGVLDHGSAIATAKRTVIMVWASRGAVRASVAP